MSGRCRSTRVPQSEKYHHPPNTPYTPDSHSEISVSVWGPKVSNGDFRLHTSRRFSILFITTLQTHKTVNTRRCLFSERELSEQALNFTQLKERFDCSPQSNYRRYSKMGLRLWRSLNAEIVGRQPPLEWPNCWCFEVNSRSTLPQNAKPPSPKKAMRVTLLILSGLRGSCEYRYEIINVP